MRAQGFFILITLIFILALNVYAEPVKSTTLIEQAKDYDNKTITYQGEVVGDVMIRGEFAWVNLNDRENAIGIWMPMPAASLIHHTGSYKARGDVIEVTGIFHRACAQHGGDMDIHAESGKSLQLGSIVTERVEQGKKNTALILAGVLCLALILKILQKK